MGKRLIIALLTIAAVILWPVNLYLKNTTPDFITYIIPAALLLISYFLYIKYPKYYLIPLLAIGMFEKKLLILPLIFALFEVFTRYSKTALVFLILSLSLFVWQFSMWRGQTVFNKDYEAEQLVLRNIHLYPNIPMARMFQNKPGIYVGKIENNLFTLIDINNYFFANHPAPTNVPTQELYKFFYPLIIFLILGIYHIKNHPHKSFIVVSFTACVFALSLLNNFDRNDFILWVPISLLTYHGIKKIF